MDKVRGSFRTREDGTLEVSACVQCAGATYRVEEGMWLHWATVGEACPQEASVTVEKVAFGPAMGDRYPTVLDSPERGLARARLTATYRRPSWEWIACR